MKTPYEQFVERHILRGRNPDRKPGAYPGPDTATGKQRMLGDAGKIRDVASWPVDPLRLKTQPWVTEASGFRAGSIVLEDVLRLHWHVRLENGKVEEFDSILDLVKEWSVD